MLLAAQVEGDPLALACRLVIQVIEVRVTVRPWAVDRSRLSRPVAHRQLGFFQDVEIDLGALGTALAGLDRVRAWQACSTSAMISATCDHLGFSSSRAGSSRACPGGCRRHHAAVLSPGMVLRLTTMPAISRMRAAISPERVVPSGPTIDLAVHIGQVGVGAAEGDAQAAFLQPVGQSHAVFDDLVLAVA